MASGLFENKYFCLQEGESERPHNTKPSQYLTYPKPILHAYIHTKTITERHQSNHIPSHKQNEQSTSPTKPPGLQRQSQFVLSYNVQESAGTHLCSRFFAYTICNSSRNKRQATTSSDTIPILPKHSNSLHRHTASSALSYSSPSRHPQGQYRYSVTHDSEPSTRPLAGAGLP